MDVSQLLHRDTPAGAAGPAGGYDMQRPLHAYPTRQGTAADTLTAQRAPSLHRLDTSDVQVKSEPVSSAASPSLNSRGAPKQVTFHLHGTRRTLRVNVKVSEDTDKIVATVKNHFGAYDGDRVEFEDHNGAPMEAHYDNWPLNGKVFVRFTPHIESADATEPSPQEISPLKPSLGPPFQMSPPQMHTYRSGSRPDILRCPSPATSIRNSMIKAQPSPRNLSLLTDIQRDYDNSGALSDSDAGSMSSSRRARSDHLANPDISTENIVGGTRRIPQVAKFESSELPLFKPPQMPFTASISSASPQRRNNNGFGASPLPPHAFSYPPQLLSPQSFGTGEAQPHHSSMTRETRSGGRLSGARVSGGSSSGLLPTPAPTIGSIISDEDVAYQLMRLGDPSNLYRDRTSTSTLADDALSGKAELASSIEYSDEDDDNDAAPRAPAHSHKKRRLTTGAAADGYARESSPEEYEARAKDHRHGKPSSSRHASSSNVHKKKKQQQQHQHQHQHEHQQRPQSPGASGAKSRAQSSIPRTLPSTSRKASVSSVDQHGSVLAEDEEDLSAKPRCQRCRKSKKGCDRQRPCQRCKDAGIGVDGCVSEDEGNGRKGRFGRHMGVTIKKADVPGGPASAEYAYAPPHSHALHTHGDDIAVDKNRKRKR